VAIRQFLADGLGGSFSSQAFIGHEIVVAIESVSDESPQTQITFESPISFGGSLAIRPLSLKSIVVDFLDRVAVPSDVSYMPLLSFILEVIESTRVTVQSVCDNICLSQRR
jgi:hypothetical protein